MYFILQMVLVLPTSPNCYMLLHVVVVVVVVVAVVVVVVVVVVDRF